MAKVPSKDDQIREIIKCGREPVHFINTWCKIQHAQRGTISFETYNFQDDVIDCMLKHRFNIVLKSRQLGLSTITAAYAVWLAIFYKDKNILIIATKKETAINLVKKIKFAIQNLPQWLLLPSYTETMTDIRFSNGSSIKAIPTSPDAGRSEALSLLIVDEAAFIRDFEQIWTGLYPTLTTGGNAIVLSTPNGVGGMYYKLWTDAEAKQNDFNTIRLPWYVHPEHDQVWFDKETRGLPKRKVSQEYLCDFLSSGDTFLQPDVLEILNDEIADPIEMLGNDRNIWIWKRPISEHRYVISADVARGDASDYSAFHIIDAETCEVVGEYMGKAPPEKLAEMMIEQGTKYNEALLIPENNSFGYATCMTLKRSNYKRLYYQKHKGDPFTYMPDHSTDEQIGFSTQQRSRVQILTRLEELLRNKLIHTRSRRLFTQLQAFVWKGARPEASKDSHDDLIMSLAIGAWIVGGAAISDGDDYELAIALLRATSVERHDHSELPRINEAKALINPNLRAITPKNVHQARDASQTKYADTIDFSWLLR